MRLFQLRKLLWAFAGAAALIYTGLLVLTIGEGNHTSEVGEPAFRAAFELTDHQGKTRTEKDFAGRWMLVFFGFTNCPDVCPTTLSEVAAVMAALGDNAAKVQPIFISIDPERDTPAMLAEYVPQFDAGIIGLTGKLEQIAKAAENFPIFFERIEKGAGRDGYTMGHTSHLFLFDPEAGLAASWPYGTRSDEILADLRERIQST